MPPPLYTDRIAFLKNVTDAYSDPVAPGHRFVVRTINVAYGGDLGTLINVFLGDLLIIVETLFTQPSGPSDIDWTGYFAMYAGERVHVTSNAQDQGVDCVVSGYNFTLP